MSFTYSTFTENTPEMREWLEGIGYSKLGAIKGKKYLIADLWNYSGSMVKSGYPVIDCTSKPELFKAVTAVREDSDYMQWYIGKMDMWHLNEDMKGWKLDPNWWRKATLEELTEHFKKTER